MNRSLPLVKTDEQLEKTFDIYEKKYKAIADKKRLHILYILTRQSPVCVCDLVSLLQMPQSKLSYHLKILLDAGLIQKETRGTWSYYSLNAEEVNHLVSEELCCLFRPPGP